MTFTALSTSALLVLGATTTLAVVAAYLLRRKARAHVVSNVEFWRRAIERSRSRTLLATRVPLLALLVSLVTALLLVMDLGNPKPGTGRARTTVIVLDADRT